jgi:hypothetical protein
LNSFIYANQETTPPPQEAQTDIVSPKAAAKSSKDPLGACMANAFPLPTTKKPAAPPPPVKKLLRCAVPSCKKTGKETKERVLYKDKAHKGSTRYCYNHSLEYPFSTFEPCGEQFK